MASPRACAVAVAVAGTEEIWAPAVVDVVMHFAAGKVICETNHGGAMTLNTIARAAAARGLSRIIVEPVVASKAKLDRALPTAQQYNIGKLHHVGVFKDLESELTSWSPKSGRPSPNLLDALAHAVNEILPDEFDHTTGPLSAYWAGDNDDASRTMWLPLED